jgi:hypothetical protein
MFSLTSTPRSFMITLRHTRRDQVILLEIQSPSRGDYFGPISAKSFIEACKSDNSLETKDFRPRQSPHV